MKIKATNMRLLDF